MLSTRRRSSLRPASSGCSARKGLKTELFSCLIETNTPVCESAAEARDELVRLRGVVRDAAAREGLAVAAAGTHPFSRARGAGDRGRAALPEDARGARAEAAPPARLRPARPRRHGELRRVPADARGDRSLAARPSSRSRSTRRTCRARRRARSRLGRPGWASCRGAARSRHPSHRPRTGRPRSRRPDRTTRAAGGMRALTRGSARSRCGSPTSRRASAARRRSPRWSRRSAPERSGGAARGRATLASGPLPARGSAPTERAADAGRAGRARARHVGARRDPARPAEALRQLEVGASRRPQSPSRPSSSRAPPHERLLRSALYPLRLVAARLGRRSAPVVLVVLGIAAGASVVFGGRAGTLVAQDRAVAQAIERIPEGERSVRAVWFGIPAQSDEPQPALDRRARAALEQAGRRRRHLARPLPRDHDRRDVRRPRRRRRPRQLGDAALRPAAGVAVLAGALRGAAACAARGGCRSRPACGSSRSARRC